MCRPLIGIATHCCGAFPHFSTPIPRGRAETLDYVFAIQARNVGIHSRFIDGVVLEDGLELDELVAPLVALKSYIDADRRRELAGSVCDRDRCNPGAAFRASDPATGLYETFQDAEDEYVQKPFSVYDNVLAWKALSDLAALEKSRSGRDADDFVPALLR